MTLASYNKTMVLHRLLPLALALALVQQTTGQSPRLPAFADYPAVPTGPAKAPIHLVRGTVAWEYRSVLRAGYARTQVNLAGHFVLTHWGCGTNCQQLAIIDAMTGAVVIPEVQAEQGYATRSDSRLVEANPASTIARQCSSSDDPMPAWYCDTWTVYYLWDGQRLSAIDSVQAGHPRGQ
jgi:hypothetical protein